jgi:RHS repeat-associated protein
VPGFSNVTYALQYKYDADGKVTNRVLSVSGAEPESVTNRYQYDNMDRVTNITQNSGAALAQCGYTYDAAGRLQMKSYGNSDTESFLYDAESRLTNLVVTGFTPTNLPAYSLRRNVMGNITQEVVAADGSVQTNLYSYDVLDRLESSTENRPSEIINRQYSYDSAGNLLFDPGSTGTVHRLYSDDNELLYTSASTTRTINVSGTVEPGPASNKWYNSKAGLGSQTVQVSQANGSFAFTNVVIQNGGSNNLQVTVRDVSGNTATQNIWYIRSAVESFGYDANGNMTYWKKADGTEMQYVYDILDRLYQVTRNGTNVLQNSFDPFGRRIAKTEVIGGTTNREYYVYEGMSVIAVLDEAGRIKESFTRDPGIAGDVGSLIASTDHTGQYSLAIYLHSDHRGNIIAARSWTATFGAWSYDAWGVLTTNTGSYVSRFLFSSKELDRSAGLYHYGFRGYAPELKRWISADPLGEAGGLNLYAFCANDPVNAVDPWGLRDVDVYVWEWHTMGGQVGHVMITEHGSTTVLLSQFPIPRGLHEPNHKRDYTDTLNLEGAPAKIFIVNVPNDSAFDAMVANHVARYWWDFRPSSSDETHCTRAAYDALKAGGVPVFGQDSGQFLPGNLGSMLEKLGRKIK